MSGVLMTIVALHAAPASATPPAVFNPAVEAQNFSITQQRQAIYDTPQYQGELAADSQQGRSGADRGRRSRAQLHGRPLLEPLQRLRRRHPTQQLGVERLRDRPAGAVHGAQRRDAVRTRVGDRRRTGQAARDGDHQRLSAGRREDVLVRRADAREGRVRGADLRPSGAGEERHVRRVAGPERGGSRPDRRGPFYDGTEDAIDFLLSTPRHPYEPVPSCTTGTSHAAKQNARVTAGLDAPYNPFWQLLDPPELGIAGHSYGAAGVSYIGQWDPRVKAIVAWDDLGGPGPTTRPVPGAAPGAPAQTIGEADARRTRPTGRRSRSPSRRSGCPPTTGSRRRRTRRCPTRTPSRRGR